VKSGIDPGWEEDLRQKSGAVNFWLEKLLPPADSVPRELHEAMRYCVMAGGKRLRPLLALYAYEVCGKPYLDIIKPACALEYIHTYSLIHDDLPCMDNDDLRRGQPTVHRKFGEALAVLAGDALHAYAFELLASTGRAEVVEEVAHAIGNYGMLGGQICDIMAENREVTLEEVEQLHRGKPGAQIRATRMVGAILGGMSANDIRHLYVYGEKIGLAFQIVDDILDVTAESSCLGKTVRKDLESGKATYPKVVGIQKSWEIARALVESAKQDIEKMSIPAAVFKVIAEVIVSRQN